MNQFSVLTAIALLGFSAGAFGQENVLIEKTPEPARESKGDGTASDGKTENQSECPRQVAMDAEAGEPGKGPSVWWAKVPPVQAMPRLGDFLVPPSDEGYYSLRAWIEGNQRTAPLHPYFRFGLYPPSFFDSDFRYLDKPDNKDVDFFDFLKRRHPCDDVLITLGGELRWRFAHETDVRLSGRNNSYDLLRTRLYGDFWYTERLRFFIEYLDAQVFNQDFTPLGIDHTKGDLLNCFVDLQVCSFQNEPVYYRIGRQELLYGSQRLISTLDWANTRRTFQGMKGFWQKEQYSFDVFWVQPVIPDGTDFDSVDDDANFVGAWWTYRPQKGTFLDLYYLNLDQARPVAVGQFNQRGGYNVSTLGSRFAGNSGNVLYDVEAMYQCGRNVNQSIQAGALTAGVGYVFEKLPMKPQIWAYHDTATGDPDPGQNSVHRTFNQLYPFGHYYLGWLDLIGRQNIQDDNFQLALYPTHWITTIFQYHRFRLDSAKDALYGAGGAPLRRDPTGRAGTDVGQEFDFLANFHLGVHQDVLIGYSKLYAGSFIKQTGNPDSPDLFYCQYNFRW